MCLFLDISRGLLHKQKTQTERRRRRKGGEEEEGGRRRRKKKRKKKKERYSWKHKEKEKGKHFVVDMSNKIGPKTGKEIGYEGHQLISTRKKKETLHQLFMVCMYML